MDVQPEPSVRGRLNLLVQMFENRTKAEEKTIASPCSPSKKLPVSKLQQTRWESRDFEAPAQADERRVDTSMFSVNKLIQTFDAKGGEVPVPQGPKKPHRHSADSVRRTPPSSGDFAFGQLPEVKAVVNEVFNRVEENYTTPRGSFDSRISLDRELTDDAQSYCTDSTDIESCTSAAEGSFVSSSNGGKIGALWTDESLQHMDSSQQTIFRSGSDVSQLCTKKLSQYMDVFESCLSSESYSKHNAAVEDRAALRDSVQRILSRMHEDPTIESGLCEKGMDVSVRTCKALIEMTVFVGETLKPTIGVINRSPCPLLSDQDDSTILFSTDDLALPSP